MTPEVVLESTFLVFYFNCLAKKGKLSQPSLCEYKVLSFSVGEGCMNSQAAS